MPHRRIPTDRALIATLRRRFGLDAFRPGQREVIRAVLAGRDVLAIMPTGAGKSLCYQLPALLLQGVTIVVSPLIALMKDQAGKLDELGVSAEQVNSTLTAREEGAALERIEREASEIVFTTPERLTSPQFLDTLAGRTIDFVVIDEAHCISEWGHDFRPAFLAIGAALRQLGRPPVLALTATATPEVMADITRQLALADPAVFQGGIFRPNLSFEVRSADGEREKLDALLAALDRIPGRAIVYAATIRAVERLGPAIEAAGHGVVTYHGRLAAKARHAAQERFMSGAARVMVATNAFGMGIDAPDIRAVIHHDLPASIESYYQEAGRAGRDGDTAHAVLLYDAADQRLHRFFQGGRYPSADQLLGVYRTLEQLGAAGPQTLASIQSASDVPRTKVRPALHLLKEAGLVRERRGSTFAVARGGADDATVRAVAEASEARRAADRAKLDAMLAYGRTIDCRWNTFAEYFEAELPADRCGACDNCAHPAEARIRPEVLATLEDARAAGAGSTA